MNLNLPDSAIGIIVYLTLFVGVLLLFEGMRAWLSRAESLTEARNRRMRMVKGGKSTDEVLSLLKDPDFATAKGAGSPIARLKKLLRQSGLRISLGVFGLLQVMLGAALFLPASRFLPPLHAGGIAALVAAVLPLLVLVALKEERSKKLTKQLPDALDLMGRGLRVGHPLAATIASVAEDMPDPIGTEFGIIQDQIAYGDEMTAAFHEFAERVGSEDARYLAVSIGIQHGTGGNLARVLDILSTVIRDRQAMTKKIKAVSSEGRLSALILTVLPAIIFMAIHTSTPSFYGDVMDDPLFKPFAAAILGLVIFQGLLLRRLVTFKF
ncbi:type II secretion system F family protein [Psychromarinibacter halotolerans]|uniref:Type II secretion system F family protein n=1 Tax=Psychromarinibacter halotolerans TaxID=1775175 RepID=A0ABV7GPK2_9RHOB|nr:type II secretion system F family protein [Psychromarinibacter halotolerans]MDF0594606.1 type II secretion system F family protein [Psychromarinibacter halotolerans]